MVIQGRQGRKSPANHLKSWQICLPDEAAISAFVATKQFTRAINRGTDGYHVG